MTWVLRGPEIGLSPMEHHLHHHFDEGRYWDGIFKAIAQVALLLEHHFPREPEHRAEASTETAGDSGGNLDKLSPPL